MRKPENSKFQLSKKKFFLFFSNFAYLKFPNIPLLKAFSQYSNHSETSIQKTKTEAK